MKACFSDGFLWTLWKAFNALKRRIMLLQFKQARWTGWHHNKKTRSSNRSAAVSSCHCRGKDGRCTLVLQGLADFWECKTFLPLIREASSVLTSRNRHTHIRHANALLYWRYDPQCYLPSWCAEESKGEVILKQRCGCSHPSMWSRRSGGDSLVDS